MRVTVAPLFNGSPGSNSASLDLVNDYPSPPTSPTYTVGTVSPDNVAYQLSWVVPAEDDLVRVAVWLSSVSGFNPAATRPYWDFVAGTPGSSGIPLGTSIIIPLTAGAHPAYYYRIALFDVWGNEIMSNITAEQTIAAYP
jgi:hypothetical protein